MSYHLQNQLVNMNQKIVANQTFLTLFSDILAYQDIPASCLQYKLKIRITHINKLIKVNIGELGTIPHIVGFSKI